MKRRRRRNHSQEVLAYMCMYIKLSYNDEHVNFKNLKIKYSE